MGPTATSMGTAAASMGTAATQAVNGTAMDGSSTLSGSTASSANTDQTVCKNIRSSKDRFRRRKVF